MTEENNVNEKTTIAYSRKILITVSLCLGFLGLGACIAIPGPTLKVLSDNINGTIYETSWIFTGRSFGYIVGSIVGGALFDCLDQMLLLSLSMFCSAIPSFLIPDCTNLPYLATMVGLQGVSMGFLDSGGNVVCINMWGAKSPSALQSLHFFFGFGAFIAPILSKPFLAYDINIDIPNPSNVSSSSSSLLPSLINSTFRPLCITSSNYSIISWFENLACTCSIKCPYVTISIYLGVVGLFIILLYLFPHKNPSLMVLDPEDTTPLYKPIPMRVELTLLFMLSTFFFCYVGMEVTYGGLVASYSSRTYNFSQQSGALVTSLFWGAFSMGRLVSIFIANHISSGVMIVINLILTLLSLITLSISHYFTLQQSTEILYGASACLGLGMSSIFPSGVAWVGSYLKLTGKYASIFVVGSALGEMFLPILAAYLMMINNIYLIYMLLGFTIFSLILFTCMGKVARVIVRLDGRGYMGVRLGEEVVSLTNLTNVGEGGEENDDDDEDDLFDDTVALAHQNNKHVKFDLKSSSMATSLRHNNKSILKSKDVMKND